MKKKTKANVLNDCLRYWCQCGENWQHLDYSEEQSECPECGRVYRAIVTVEVVEVEGPKPEGGWKARARAKKEGLDK